MDPREQFSANLRRLRTRTGMSQEALGDACDLHRTEISLLERGGREPRLLTILKLSRALGVPLAALLEGID